MERAFPASLPDGAPNHCEFLRCMQRPGHAAARPSRLLDYMEIGIGDQRLIRDPIQNLDFQRVIPRG
jgi:hypothetical protein